jgi:hypothetical protein
MEEVGVFDGNLVYFTDIWYVYFVANLYILWPICIFYGYLVYFFPFWFVVPRKIWRPSYASVISPDASSYLEHTGVYFL